MIPEYPIYLFDVDGTLVDSAADICGAIQGVLADTPIAGEILGRHLSEPARAPSTGPSSAFFSLLTSQHPRRNLSIDMLRWFLFMCALPIGATVINSCGSSNSATVVNGTATCVDAQAAASILLNGDIVDFSNTVEAASTFTVEQAQSSTNASFLLVTAGPVRNGYITFIPSAEEQDTGQSAAGFQSSINGLAVGGFPKGFLTPVALGTAVPFVYQSTANSFYDQASGGGGAQLSFTLTVEFFEADGITPVAVSMTDPAPEPATLGLLTVVLPALWRIRSPITSGSAERPCFNRWSLRSA